MKGLLIDILGMRILLAINTTVGVTPHHIEAPKNDLTLFLDFDGVELKCKTEPCKEYSAERVLYALYVYLFKKAGFPRGEYDAIINGRKYLLCGDINYGEQIMENVGKCNGIFTETLKIKGIDEIRINRLTLGNHSLCVYECHDVGLVDIKTLGRRVLMHSSHLEQPHAFIAVSFSDGKYTIRQTVFGTGETVPDAYSIGAVYALYGEGGREITVLGDFGRASAKRTSSFDILVYPQEAVYLEVDF